MSVRRHSVTRLDGSKARRLDGGFLEAPAHLTRAGVFTYLLPGGKVKRELRPPDEVFKAESLESAKLVPLTEDLAGLGRGHPREGAVTAKTARRVTVGVVGQDVRQDGDHVAATVRVNDADAIARVDSGKVFLSCGYSADTDDTPGEWNGQRYDAIQRNIRYNHVAIVDAGRAGPSARLHLDSQEDPAVGFEIEEVQDPQGVQTMRKFVIDGVEFEVSESAAQSWEKERKALEAKATEQKTRADAAEAKLAEAEKVRGEATLRADAAEKKATELEAKIPERVAARVALIGEARKVLGAEVKLDALDEVAIRKAVIVKVDPEAKLDGVSPDFVAGAYAAAVKAHAAKPAEERTVRVDAAAAAPTLSRREAFQKACEAANVVK